jgi:hypothetical protein
MESEVTESMKENRRIFETSQGGEISFSGQYRTEREADYWVEKQEELLRLKTRRMN